MNRLDQITKHRPKHFSFSAVILASLLILVGTDSNAQEQHIQKSDISAWLNQYAVELSQNDLSGNTDDLYPLIEMVGNARIVAISESIHAAKEPMLFRNRVFKFLVEELGFDAIAIESGVVESQLVDNYVTGSVGDPDFPFESGISNGFDQFQQNQELIYWMGQYNKSLPTDSNKLRFFGIDMSGSPYHSLAARNPDTAIRTALEFLEKVDSESAVKFSARFEPYLPVLAEIFAYGSLTYDERNELTASIAELVSLFQRRRFQYISASNRNDYEWGAHAAVAASQADAWFREIPIEWESSDGFEWNIEAQEMRDRIMFDNLEWILDQLGDNSRLVVFASVAHITSSPWYLTSGGTDDGAAPFGRYARDKYGDDWISILSLAQSGVIDICAMPSEERLSRELAPPPEEAVEAMFALEEKPNYFVDLRTAPSAVTSWLHLEQDHWNGFGSYAFATIPSFDVAYFLNTVSPDCVQ
ncbi:MAG: erythromycin esterase family protein [Pseudohongiella sp.]|uniref:erythromycin esterase family protein n=1 Tax=Pseudohongiella sp. TaxID=1979412 RepID=UPI0034A06667